MGRKKNGSRGGIRTHDLLGVNEEHLPLCYPTKFDRFKGIRKLSTCIIPKQPGCMLSIVRLSDILIHYISGGVGGNRTLNF